MVPGAVVSQRRGSNAQETEEDIVQQDTLHNLLQSVNAEGYWSSTNETLEAIGIRSIKKFPEDYENYEDAWVTLLVIAFLTKHFVGKEQLTSLIEKAEAWLEEYSKANDFPLDKYREQANTLV